MRKALETPPVSMKKSLLYSLVPNGVLGMNFFGAKMEFALAKAPLQLTIDSGPKEELRFKKDPFQNGEPPRVPNVREISKGRRASIPA